MKTLLKLLISLSILTLLAGCQSQDDSRRSTQAQTPADRIIYDDAAVLLDNDKFVREFTRYNRWLKKRYDIDSPAHVAFLDFLTQESAYGARQ